MTEIGYALSSEEHAPNDLVPYARRAEEAGFGYALIPDPYHPWTDRQGQSPFVWAVVGAASAGRTEEEARRTAYEWWPAAAVKGDLSQELPLRAHFEQAAEMVSEDGVAAAIACGPDPQAHLELIFSLHEREVLPRYR